MIAEHGEDAAWVRNLRANPAVSVRVGARCFAARARVVDARAERELWRDVRDRSEAKYAWGDGLVVELSAEAEPGSNTTTPRACASPPS